MNIFLISSHVLKFLALFSNFVLKSVAFHFDVSLTFSGSFLLNLGHCYLKVCSASFLFVASKFRMRLLYIYYFRDIIFYRMLESISISFLIFDSFQKFNFFYQRKVSTEEPTCESKEGFDIHVSSILEPSYHFKTLK